MVFGAILGAAAGVLAGTFAYKAIPAGHPKDPKTYDYIDVTADHRDEFREEWKVDAKDSEVKRVLERSPYWCTFPDFERFLWLNNFIKIIWERNSAATKKTVQQVITDGLPEWSKLTSEATKGMITLDAIDIEQFDFGRAPLRCAGVKLYDTSQDEVILDMPVQWGSQADICVSARVGIAGKAQLYLPITLKNLQVSACARITMRPLVDEIPVIGAVNITLLDDPIVDVELYIDQSTDVIGLPLMHVVLQKIMKMALSAILVYPNSMTFDIMENAGLPPPMAGMLVVKVVSCTKLPSSLYDKIDPYVEVEVRKGKALKTSTVDNDDSPVFTEELGNTMRFVIDDPATQRVRVLVKDEDVIMDATVGYVEIPLKDSPFVANPRKTFEYDASLQLLTKKQKKAGLKAEEIPEDLGDEPLPMDAGPSAPAHADKPATQADFAAAAAAAGKSPEVEVAGEPKKRSGMHERLGLKRKEKVLQRTTTQKGRMITIQGVGKSRGSVQLQMTFFPFSADDADLVAAAGRKRGQLETIAKVVDSDRAVITATLMACHGLEDGCDPYVVITLYDRLQGRSEVFKSDVKMNEANPRWDMAFDFVDVSAASRVTVVVFDKGASGLLPGLVSTAVSTVMALVKKPEQRKLGWVELPLAEVAKNGIVKDRFNLRDAVKGEIELKFEWHTIKRRAEDMAMLEEEMAKNKAKEREAYAKAHAI